MQETPTPPGLHCPQGTVPLHKLKGAKTAQILEAPHVSDNLIFFPCLQLESGLKHEKQIFTFRLSCLLILT